MLQTVGACRTMKFVMAVALYTNRNPNKECQI